MQNSHDLDQARLAHAIEEYMNRALDWRLAAFFAAVADMKAAHAGP
jgi:hypothetical protein